MNRTRFSKNPSAIKTGGFAASGWLLVITMALLLVPQANVSGAESLLRATKDPAFTEFFRQTNGWNAGDGALSISLSDGRVIWLFGDSYINQLNPETGALPCLFNARNAVLVQSSNDSTAPKTLSNSNSGSQTFFYPPEAKPGASWPCFWPGPGFQISNTVYIYLSEIDKTPQGGMWGFKGVGQSWVKLSFPDLKIIEYVKLPVFNGISFACGFVPDEPSGLVYAYGNKRTRTSSDVYVARFPAAAPEGRWSFWDGQQWVGDAAKAAVITKGTSTSVNICRVKGKLLLITTEFSVACDQGKEIYISTSTQFTGPFSRPRSIYAVDDLVKGHRPFFYAAVPHPEFINAQNELLIVYSINGYEPCIPSCVDGKMDPDYYRPRAIRLKLDF